MSTTTVQFIDSLSVRQPWAWLIVHGLKDIENRDWEIFKRGRVMIHASKTCTRYEYEEACNFAYRAGIPRFSIPPLSELDRGGLVGSVDIVDCVTRGIAKRGDYVAPNPWFLGRYGAVLRNPKTCQFYPFPGRLGFFKAPQIQ